MLFMPMWQRGWEATLFQINRTSLKSKSYILTHKTVCAGEHLCGLWKFLVYFGYEPILTLTLRSPHAARNFILYSCVGWGSGRSFLVAQLNTRTLMRLLGNWEYDMCKHLVHGGGGNLIVHCYVSLNNVPWICGPWYGPWYGPSFPRGTPQILLLPKIAARDLVMVSCYLRDILSLEETPPSVAFILHSFSLQNFLNEFRLF